jgi:hypothetical protein
MRKWFYEISTGVDTGALAVVLLLEGNLVSWSLAMDERGEHENLRGSNCRSIIPYVHGKTELYCSSMSCLSLSFYPSL